MNNLITLQLLIKHHFCLFTEATRTLFTSATDAEVELIIKEWLRPAKYRASKYVVLNKYIYSTSD